LLRAGGFCVGKPKKILSPKSDYHCDDGACRTTSFNTSVTTFEPLEHRRGSTTSERVLMNGLFCCCCNAGRVQECKPKSFVKVGKLTNFLSPKTEGTIVTTGLGVLPPSTRP
jgi:hypothetical protein